MIKIPAINPEARYKVNSFGQIFEVCKPICKIDTRTKLGVYYQFESEDVDTRGVIITCFDKDSFVLIDS